MADDHIPDDDEIFFPDDEPLEFIPELLHSFEKDGPFTSCVECVKELYESGSNYIVQKSIHRGETVFEFALCNGCHENMQNSMSKETIKNLNAHFQQLEQCEPSIDTCLDCQCARSEVSSYNVSGLCLGPFLDSGYLLCENCQEKIHPLISEETRKTRDDWIGQNFPCAPESRDIIPDSPLPF